MRRPRIKFAHRPVRYSDGHIRLGGIVPGIRLDLADDGGWLWVLLGLLDGRIFDAVVTAMRDRFPGTTEELVRAAVADLELAGHLEEAEAPPAGVDRDRYSRSVELYKWMDLTPGRSGWDVQDALAGSSVVIVGLGGAGCVAAMNLVQSGVGRVHCVDRDVVERSNFNRQLLYQEADEGAFKAEAAVRRLRAHNSTIDISGEVLDVTGPDVLRGLAAGFDVLLLTADKPRDIRSWANRACLETGTPWVCSGYHGPLVSIGLFVPGTGPCFECGAAEERARLARLPERTEWPPAAGVEAPHAANAITVGYAGNAAAHAVISLITDVPPPVVNVRRGFNVVTSRMVPVAVLDAPSPLCPACGPGQ
ncbi:HesA/MoeB/ThiF family protein [Saccharothrix sp. Mg75]|uniref:HesA/MoeB/ThiF family protein n=1 Tax=Saccharothrix sp. Mg75 TaxID=3445357 RepID=UPI003EEE8E25